MTLIPCIGQHECPAIESISTLVQKITAQQQRWQYICNSCYESQGGHLYQHKQPGSGNKK
ncbi:6587_t:CDS:1, partial [Paraglomus occultum]